MADPTATTLTERYMAVEQAYSAQRWSTVLQLGQALMRDLQIEATPTALALRQRLQLMLAHTQLYGFTDADAAADLYRALMNQCNEATLRQMAEQGLQQCRALQASAGAAASPGGPGGQTHSRPATGPSSTGGATSEPRPSPTAASVASVASVPAEAAAAAKPASEAAAALNSASSHPAASESAAAGTAVPASTARPAGAADTTAAGAAAGAAAPWLADLGAAERGPVARTFLVQDPFLAATDAAPAQPASGQPDSALSRRGAAAGEPAEQDQPASESTSAMPPAGASAAGGRGTDGLPASEAGSSAQALTQAAAVAGAVGGSAALAPAAQETLIPEVVEEPELIELHQADPELAQELELRLAGLPLSQAAADPQAEEGDADLQGCLLLVRLDGR